MVIDRVYKISAFGNFSDITPDTETMMFLLNEFKEDGLIPSMVQEVAVSNVTPAIPKATTNRIALLSSDAQEQAIVGTNRIDYAITLNGEEKITSEKLEYINKRINKFFRVIFGKYDRKANRLALNTESLIINLTSQEIDAFISKYKNPISIYGERLDEWNVHLMVKKEILMGENEAINVISDIAKSQITKTVGEKNEVFDGFVVQTDINTIAENSLYRFSHQSVEIFIQKVNELWNLVMNEM